MALLRNRRVVVGLLVVLVISAGWIFSGSADVGDTAVWARARRGEFAVTVATAGELSARESVKITAPSNARQAGIYQIRIASLVPEGTLVKPGDLVAQLDRSELASKQAEAALALEKAEAVYEQAMLDSTLTLSQAREEIRSFELALEEARLAKEQSIYEPPTVRRQAEIDLERADRALTQGRLDYQTKTEQSRAKMREVGADVERERNKLTLIEDAMQGFTVTAPGEGMVIYEKEWNGRKRTVGSQISSWDPTVATLPDLSKMESITYVNEIDIRKISEGQKVEITLDSDPTKQLSGTVTSVANVGEQRPNTDAKVFEVRITVAEADTTLRPGMTTGNSIVTFQADDALFIPIEALNSERGIPFVFRQDGGAVRKQEVIVQAMNDVEAMVTDGLEEGDRILLTVPPNRDDLKVQRLPNSPVVTTDSTADRAETIELDPPVSGR